MAFDLALTVTGLCDPEGGTAIIKPPQGCIGVRRLDFLRSEVMMWCVMDAPDVVVLEGYSYGSRGRAAVSLRELGGVIRLALDDDKRRVVEIPPTCRTKYATGRGNASKDDVLQAGVLRSGHIFKDNNACDAWWLHQMALAALDPTNPLRVPMPKTHLAALEGVQW